MAIRCAGSRLFPAPAHCRRGTAPSPGLLLGPAWQLAAPFVPTKLPCAQARQSGHAIRTSFPFLARLGGSGIEARNASIADGRRFDAGRRPAVRGAALRRLDRGDCGRAVLRPCPRRNGGRAVRRAVHLGCRAFASCRRSLEHPGHPSPGPARTVGVLAEAQVPRNELAILRCRGTGELYRLDGLCKARTRRSAPAWPIGPRLQRGRLRRLGFRPLAGRFQRGISVANALRERTCRSRSLQRPCQVRWWSLGHLRLVVLVRHFRHVRALLIAPLLLRHPAPARIHKVRLAGRRIARRAMSCHRMPQAGLGQPTKPARLLLQPMTEGHGFAG
jgi:hypothetical protein